MPLAARRAIRSLLDRPMLVVWLLTALAGILRLYRLTGQPLRWDEGFSLAQASLPWSQLLAVARQEWHPPLYAMLLKAWLVVGKSAWSIRFLSVLASTLAVPLAWGVARAWSGSQRTAILAAALVATWPLLVLYGQVARMYGLAELLVLAAAWFLLRPEAVPSWQNDLGAALASLAALYTFFYTGFALAGVWLYALLARSRTPRRLVATGVLVAAAYAPWLALTAANLRTRITPDAAATDAALRTLRLVLPTLQSLLLDPEQGRALGLTMIVVLLGALVASPLRGSGVKVLLLPLLVVGGSVLGAAYGAGVAYWVAARHLVPAAPFFLLALAWALDRLARFRPRPGLLAVSLLAMGVAGWPLAASVYGTSPEVVDSYDPAADHSYLAGQAGPHDLVFFNTVARAGWYEALRGPAEASWALALRWEPIVEPLDEIVPRIQSASATHRSLWFALYNGSYGTNGPLVDWLDANLFPAAGSWQGDTLYSAYVAPRIMAAYEGPEVRFEEGIRLVSARYTAEAAPGGACAVELTWAADGPVTGDYKVFVHAVDAEGRLVTQHDAVPGMGQRPVSTWAAEEAVLDRHGLLLPPDLTGPLEARLQVGLYSAESGERLRLPDGSDHVDIGACTTRGE